MARSFFFVCAGLFLLAAAYALRARNAVAEGGVTLEGPELAQHGGSIDASGCANRLLYVGGTQVVPAPVPGTSPIVETAVLANSSQPYGVILANGDTYVWQSGTWVLVGNVIGVLPTGPPNSTWGGTKAKYR